MSCWHLHISSALVLFFLITWLIFNTAARIIPSFTNQNRSALLSKLHTMIPHWWYPHNVAYKGLWTDCHYSSPHSFLPHHSGLLANLKTRQPASAFEPSKFDACPFTSLGTELFFLSESFPKHEVKDCNPHPLTSFYFPSFISLLSI